MDNIGLIIWGCRGGYKIFCTNGVVDYKNSSIADTVKDLRGFLRFQGVKQTIYAIEFTKDHKVYTIYRSCSDNGQGAYVAMSVYVPHGKKLKNLKSLLDSMMDAYYKEYLHPIFGTYKDVYYDDIGPYAKMLSQAHVEEDLVNYRYKTSEQGNTYGCIVYDDASRVDEVFESPYRRELFQVQEVLFISKSLYDDRPNSFIFETSASVLIIDKLSAPESFPTLYLDFGTMERYSLKINDIEYRDGLMPYINTEKDTIYLLIKYKHCEDIVLTGNVKDRIKSGELKYDASKNQVIIGRLEKKYQSYSIKFNRINTSISWEDIQVYLQKENDKHNLVDINNGIASIDGRYLDSRWKLYLEVQNRLVLLTESFIPRMYMQSPYILPLSVFSFCIQMDSNVSKTSIEVSMGTFKMNFPLPEQYRKDWYKIVIPSEWENSDVVFSVNDSAIDCLYNKETKLVRLSAKPVKILDYSICQETMSLWREYFKGELKWDFKIANESKKKKNTNTIKLGDSDNISQGELIINDKTKYEYEVRENVIYPKVLYISVAKGSSASLNDIKLKEGLTIMPYRASIPTASPNADCYGPETKNHITKYKIEKKQPKTDITFHDCDDLYIYIHQNNEYKRLSGKDPISFNADSVTLYDRKERAVGKIYKSEEKYNKGSRFVNWLNGLKVTYQFSEGDFHVNVYKNRSKWIYVILAFILLLSALTVGMGILVKGIMDRAKVVHITEFKLDSSQYSEDIIRIKLIQDQSSPQIEKMQPRMIDVGSNYIRLSGYKSKLESLIKDTTITITLQFDVRGNHYKVKSYKVSDFSKNDSLTIPSPVAELVNSTIDSIESLSLKTAYENFKRVEQDYEKARDTILTILRNKMQEVSDTTKLAQFVNNTTATDNSFYVSVKEGFANLKEHEKEKNEKKKKIEELRAAADKNKELLWADTCTVYYTVDKVEKWYNNLSRQDKKQVNTFYNFGVAISAYKAFFQCSEKDGEQKKRMDDVYAKHVKKDTGIFSSHQKDVIKAYSSSTKNFRRLCNAEILNNKGNYEQNENITAYGITFNIPKEIIATILNELEKKL